MKRLPILPPEVAAAFDAYPPAARERLLAVRRLIHETAAETEGVGPLTEALKWGEPAFLTPASKSGSTIRLAWKRATPDSWGVYFNCKTTLVAEFRDLFEGALAFEGNRAIVLKTAAPIPHQALRACLARALTYHLRKGR